MSVKVVPARLDWLEALTAGDEIFTDRFGIPVVDGWVGFPEALPVTLEEARRQPGNVWGPHLFFDDDDGAVVGFGGFKGAPRGGEVEVGYAVAPARQGRGIATEVVRQFVLRAIDAGVSTVTAHTLGEENSSVAVLRRNGFVHTADLADDGLGAVWRWELRLDALVST